MEGQGLQGKNEGSEIKWQPQLPHLSLQNFEYQTVNAARKKNFL